MHRLKIFTALACLVAMSGCTALGMNKPRDFNERLAYAVAEHTAVVKSTNSALSFDEITVADAEAVLKLAEDSRLALDAAKLASESGDLSTAEGKLTAALALLEQVENKLRESKGKNAQPSAMTPADVLRLQPAPA